MKRKKKEGKKVNFKTAIWIRQGKKAVSLILLLAILLLSVQVIYVTHGRVHLISLALYIALGIGSILLIRWVTDRRADQKFLETWLDLGWSLKYLPRDPQERFALSQWAESVLAQEAHKVIKIDRARDDQEKHWKKWTQTLQDDITQCTPPKLIEYRSNLKSSIQEERRQRMKFVKFSKEAEKQHRRFNQIWDLLVNSEGLGIVSHLHRETPKIFLESLAADTTSVESYSCS